MTPGVLTHGKKKEPSLLKTLLWRLRESNP